MKKICIGIDPGMTGAVAFLGDEVRVVDCPPTIREMGELFRSYEGGFNVSAAIEKVGPFYKSSAKSAFTFGGNFYAWQMALACFRIPYWFVTPRKWQNVVFDSAKRLADTKQQSFELASRLFAPHQLELKTPRGRILDGRCDALLIAEWLRRTDK